MKRAHWGSNLGFIMVVAGSAVGLANIWKFPYTVGRYGGAAFIAVYLLSLLVIGIPVFISEVLIGRNAQLGPRGAFAKLGGKVWGRIGAVTVLTGFIVSAFYCAVAGWVLGYLVEAFMGRLGHFEHVAHAREHFEELLASPWWSLAVHASFMLLCTGVLYMGVRRGIERFSKVLMPVLFVLLLALVVRGLTMPGASLGLRYLFEPDWSSLTAKGVLAALGQAFFTMSLGQGTMVTYGSYMHRKGHVLRSCMPAVLMDTVVSLLAAVAVFTLVFSVGVEPDSGPGLVFQTLPLAFSQMPMGYVIGGLFFLLITVAALTSEISAMEPAIAYLQDEKKFSRHQAVLTCAMGAFLVGVPAALSFSWLKGWTVGGMTALDLMDDLTTQLLIPFGGFVAVVRVGWVWGARRALRDLAEGDNGFLRRNPMVHRYFHFCFKCVAPLLMLLIFLNALGLVRLS